MTGELQETVDEIPPCTAVTEKRQNRLGGCVGVFFQLFDWNRRFAKKKLFSRTSLLPGKQASKRFGGNDKMLNSKLNLIDDEKRGNYPYLGEVVELRPPSLVARLMGLESMPSNQRDKGKKKKKNKSQDKVKCDLFDESRPQKMQRTTGVCDRRVVVGKKFGSDALQIKNVLTRVRKHHQYNPHQKLASPVRSPRLQRRNSRLIDAASRILEPGKRNAKSAIAFPVSSVTQRYGNVVKEPVETDSLMFQRSNDNSVASCQACGSSLVKSGKKMACVSELTPFERSKRNVFWRNQKPYVSVSGKDRDCTNHIARKPLHSVRCDFNGKQGKDERFPPESRSHILQRGSSSPANEAKCQEKGFIAMNRGSTSRNHHLKSLANDMNLHRKSHTRVEDSAKRRLACVSGHGQRSSLSTKLDDKCSCFCRNETAISPLNLGSPYRNYSQCYREFKERKGFPHQKRLPLDAGTLGLIQQKLKEMASQEEDPLPNKSASLILHELLSSIAMEQAYNRDAESVCQRKGKTEMWSSIGNANSDYTSPGSVLDASFSNESCFSNSLDNISVPGQMRLPLEPIEPDWDSLEDSATSFKNSTSGGNYQAIARLISHVSNVLRCLSNTGLILTQQRFTIAREVIILTELLVGTQDSYLIGPELFDELMIYAAHSDNLVSFPGITGGFLVDAMVEHLEERNISCEMKPSTAKTSELIQSVLEEVPKWAELARIDMDEIIGIEMEKWMMDLETYLFGLESEIAYEILWCLVGELTMDLL